MKKWMLFLVLVFGVLGLAACQGGTDEDVLHLGVNAEILEIGGEGHLLYVKGLDGPENGVLGERAAIDCQKAVEEETLFYVNYDQADHVEQIRFDQLRVGDRIILGIYESQLDQEGAILVEQLQLGTQRMG